MNLKRPNGRCRVELLKVFTSVGISKLENFLCFLSIILYADQCFPVTISPVRYIYIRVLRKIEHIKLIQNGGSKMVDGSRSFFLTANYVSMTLQLLLKITINVLTYILILSDTLLFTNFSL